jgi:hypothetical protein
VIEAKKLLADLQKIVRKLEDDLRQRCADIPDVDEQVRAEYNKAKSAGRTSQAYETWREEFITQAAVAWILGCVFVRFLEDNQLVETPYLAGTGERLNLARDQHTLYFKQHPTHSDREYLESVFRDVTQLPAMRELFDERHNSLWTLGLTGDGATLLLNFWQQVDATTGALVHDFTDEDWNTRFLGDLYQDLSEAARKKYALLQTPIFVEEFILDRTLNPAINEFGYQTIRLIDPACGSGHFLLGAFQRLFDLWVKNEPGANSRHLAQQALASVYGVDLNPFAVAIARFRLMLAALKVSDVTRLKDAPDFKINLAVGDSLLHGEQSEEQLRMGWHPMAHVYETEDREELNRILKRHHYHVVVGNPPYITVKDAALNQAYRERFGSCHMKYSLAVPFMERFFDLAIKGNGDGREPSGYVGMITSNSFMKREFGKKLIEEYIPRWDLTHVIDTSGAYIPGHVTPTVILFGKNQKPVAPTIRTVMGIKGEPSTPAEAARGLVWMAIVCQVDLAGSQSEFLSVADTTRESFHKHPWSIGGGGAAELKELLDERATFVLGDLADAIGITSVTGEDDLFVFPDEISLRRLRIEDFRMLVTGENTRDWAYYNPGVAIWLYDSNFNLLPLSKLPNTARLLWAYKPIISKRKRFGVPMLERGLTWYEWQELYAEKLTIPLSISFASVATHNHFVLDREGKIFKQSAPVIKLSDKASEEQLYGILGLLNSSTACFWMKQVFYPKGTTTGDISLEKGKPEANRYDFAATGMLSFPIPTKLKSLDTLAEIARMIDLLAQNLLKVESSYLINEWSIPENGQSLERPIQEGMHIHSQLKRRMVTLQEELDWETYKLFGLTSEGADLEILKNESLGVEPGARPCFWSSSHPPESFSCDLHSVYQRRRELTSSNTFLTLLETAVFKRLWLGQQGVFGHATSTYEERVKDALRQHMLNRLEDTRYWISLNLTSCARLADQVRQDSEFMQVAEFYRGRKDFDLLNLVTELVRSEAVPFLPILRYKESGMRNRALWEVTWENQRAEDAIDARTHLPEGDPQRLTVDQALQLKRDQIGDIPVPPKYKSTDFQDQGYWRLRGKLDVPKERFISYPHCQRDADSSMVIAWAGWNHLQQAQAIAAYYEAMRTNEGWSPERLVPLLVGLLELVPWLLQWHNEIDPVYGMRMGDFFKSFVEEELRSMGKTIDEIRDWRPQATTRRR